MLFKNKRRGKNKKTKFKFDNIAIANRKIGPVSNRRYNANLRGDNERWGNLTTIVGPKDIQNEAWIVFLQISVYVDVRILIKNGQNHHLVVIRETWKLPNYKGLPKKLGETQTIG